MLRASRAWQQNHSTMVKETGAEKFARLSPAGKSRYQESGREMVGLSEGCAVPIIYAPPVSVGGKINGATGCVLELPSGCFLVSASHVLDGYERRIESGEKLNWQVGKLPPFDPLKRIAWRDRAKDTLLLRLSLDEARKVGGCIVSACAGWPPPVPQIGQLVLVARYPRVLRELVGPEKTIQAGSIGAMFRVTTTGDGYFVCQIERADLVSFNERSPLPDPGTDFGGWSGGPALLVGAVAYPLVGVVSQYHRDFELLRIATLENVTV
jgi:hypothetical protein